MRESALEIVKRWIELDRLLWTSGFSVTRDRLARQRTISRDLAAFRELGFEVTLNREDRRWVRRYPPTQDRPMFTVNAGKKRPRAAVGDAEPEEA